MSPIDLTSHDLVKIVGLALVTVFCIFLVYQAQPVAAAGLLGTVFGWILKNGNDYVRARRG